MEGEVRTTTWMLGNFFRIMLTRISLYPSADSGQFRDSVRLSIQFLNIRWEQRFFIIGSAIMLFLTRRITQA